MGELAKHESIPGRGYGVSKWSSRPSTVFLYVLEADRWVKVGIARDPHNRLAQVAGHCPLPVSIIALRSVPYERAGRAERLAHRLLAASHHRGEWFTCSHEEAIQAISVASKAALRSGEDWDRLSDDGKIVPRKKLVRSGRRGFTVA